MAVAGKSRMSKSYRATPTVGARSGARRLTKRQRGLVEAYRPLVFSAVNAFAAHSPESSNDDLEQAGMLGLAIAATRYDPKFPSTHKPGQNVTFAHYAAFWIKKYVIQQIRMDRWLIQLPEAMGNLISTVNKLKAGLYSNFSREPTFLEIADALAKKKKIEMDDAKHLLMDLTAANESIISLDLEIGEDGNTITFGELIIVVSDKSRLTQEENEQLRVVIDKNLATLSERERLVILSRFGLDSLRSNTLEEVGRVLNTTRERVRQIEAKALRKLRHPSRARALREFL